MTHALYTLTCPLCRRKLAHAGNDGALLVYRCAQHGPVMLCSDGRIWVDELPEFTAADIAAAHDKARAYLFSPKRRARLDA